MQASRCVSAAPHNFSKHPPPPPRAHQHSLVYSRILQQPLQRRVQLWVAGLETQLSQRHHQAPNALTVALKAQRIQHHQPHTVHRAVVWGGCGWGGGLVSVDRCMWCVSVTGRSGSRTGKSAKPFYSGGPKGSGESGQAWKSPQPTSPGFSSVAQHITKEAACVHVCCTHPTNSKPTDLMPGLCSTSTTSSYAPAAVREEAGFDSSCSNCNKSSHDVI